LQHHAHIQINETTPSQPVTQEKTAHGGDTLLFTHHQPNGGIGRQEIKNRMQKLLPCKKTRQKWSFTCCFIPQAATTAPEDSEEMVPRSELDVLQSQVESLIDENIKLVYERDEALKERGHYEQERDDNKRDCQKRVQRARAEQRRVVAELETSQTEKNVLKLELDEVKGQLAVENQIHEADCRSADKKLKDTQTLLKQLEESSAETKQNLETQLSKSTETLQQKSIELEKAKEEIARLNALLKKKRTTSNVPWARKNAANKQSSPKSSKPNQRTTNTANNQGQ
jgi:hypothetical protein